MILLAASVTMLGVIARGLDRLVATPDESRATRATRLLLCAVAAVVVVEAGLGAAGLLTKSTTFIALAALAAVATAATWRRRPPGPSPMPRDPISAVDVGLAAALLAAIVPRLWAGLHRTAFLYDTLSYHLHVPATWMHDARMSIVPAVFGDPSAAYAPSNLELVFLFLMAPLRSDYLAGVGQVPFAALAAVAIVAAAREAGARRATALAAALAFILVPEVWGQAATAMTDLGLCACLLASLPFALRLRRSGDPRPADLLAFAGAIGLAVGSKYAGATLALPFLAIAVVGLVRTPGRIGPRGIAAACAISLATGGFWYVRNTVVAGNPFYPVAVPGLPLPALYGGAEMRAWEYHLSVTDLGALGSILIGAGVGFVSAAAVAIARLWRRLEAALVLALVAVFWLVIPYQESRFLFAALGVAAVALAGAADKPPTVVGWGGLGIAIAGALVQWPTRERLLLVPIGAIAAALFSLARRVGFRPNALVLRATAALAALALLAGLAAGERRYGRRYPGYTVGDDLEAAWAWFHASQRDIRVAYAGTNLAFPLAGERLSNRVAYVNVAGAPGDRLHDFGPPGDGTAEPAPYRRGASADVWLANLRAAGTSVLFVASMYPIVRRTIDADGDGFPVERAWADARPDLFHLRYASTAARIYAVEPP